MSNKQAKILESFKQYTETSWTGKELLKKHSLDEVGIWKILGEDPNPDLHGSHYQPDLGIVEGNLRDVIMYAMTLPNFWQWGSGGNFILVGKSIPKVDSNSVQLRLELEEKEKALEKELNEVKQLLGR